MQPLFYAVVAFLKKLANQNDIPFIGKRLALKGHSQPMGVKPKMRDLKLRSAVNWQGRLKQKKSGCAVNLTQQFRHSDVPLGVSVPFGPQ